MTVENGLPELWLSVDPGDKNVGVARWERETCTGAWHTNPEDLLKALWQVAEGGRLGLVVYERYQLYGDQFARQMGSDFPTVQMIGAMRFICGHWKVPTEEYLAGHHKKIYKMAEYKPPEKKLNEWKSYGQGGHAKDAECLGLYVVRRRKLSGKGY